MDTATTVGADLRLLSQYKHETPASGSGVALVLFAVTLSLAAYAGAKSQITKDK